MEQQTNSSQTCKNCGRPIVGSFCENCGQKAAQISPSPTQYPQQVLHAPSKQYAPSKGKSKLPLVIAVIVVVVCLIVAILFILVLSKEDDEVLEMTMKEFLEDYEDTDSDGNIDKLKSFDSGDKVIISDKVAGIMYEKSYDLTIIYCESTEDYKIELPIVLKGNQTDSYGIGDPITVTWHIKEYKVQGITIEYPEELFQYASIVMISTTTTTPIMSMQWIEDEEVQGNYTGSIVVLTYSDTVYLDDISVVVEHAENSQSGTLDNLAAGGTIDIGSFTLSYIDLTPVGQLGAEDVFKVAGGESGDSISFIYLPTDSIMYTGYLT
ncbi:MAG: hypothetical protein JSW00_12595 [Thermoplasmata archaeon]|nr:MAG: hypothetical protein JSW00_12595 [Thermoplasmata archaeon]